MGNTEKEIKENYDKNLKAADYVAMAQVVAKDVSDMHSFPLKFLHEILQSGKFKGSKLLEIGSGALVHYVAPASAFYPNIIMSDYVEDNCEELKLWLRGESKLTQCLDIPADIEGYGGDLEAGKQLLEARVRKSVKQVVRCDVLCDNIFLEEVKPEVAPPYDLIISCLCLESSAPDFDSFILSLKRINKLLRFGGGLFLVGFLNGDPWPSGESKFHYLKVGEEEVKEALKKSGFGKIEIKILEKFGNIDIKVLEKFNTEYGHDGYYALVAEKIENS